MWAVAMKAVVTVVISSVLLGIVQAQSDAVASSSRPQEKAAQTAGSSSEKTTTAPQPTGEPLIAAGDLIKVSVFGVPDLDREVRVSADGMILLPMIGEMRVAGLSTVQARELLERTLVEKGLMRNPQVSVMEKEYATQGVPVSGEVMKPGVYPLLGSRRLLDVISMAGGMTPKAGAEVVLTHRDRPDQPIHFTDIVYVVGDVHKPGGFVMENGNNMTVLRAISMAEGINPTASLNHARLIRKTPQGQQEIPINLKKILSSEAPDIKLEAEDIIVVPNSAAKSDTRRELESIRQMDTPLKPPLPTPPFSPPF
jgi:polysaccharide biosynthesis/export protein